MLPTPTLDPCKRGPCGGGADVDFLALSELIAAGRAYVGFWQILLQKSKVAAALVFGENLKREGIGDSYSLSRATEVAYEFSVGR